MKKVNGEPLNLYGVCLIGVTTNKFMYINVYYLNTQIGIQTPKPKRNIRHKQNAVTQYKWISRIFILNTSLKKIKKKQLKY